MSLRAIAAVVTLCGLGCVGEAAPELCPVGGTEPLTAPGRWALGDAVPYEPDPSVPEREEALALSQVARRQLGWAVAEQALRPVDVVHAADTSLTVPLFQTWYDEQDLRRVVRRVADARGTLTGAPPTTGELDEAFAWNATAVHEQEAWPADRIADYIAAIDAEERARGAGGIERVAYSPLAARHMLLSAAEFEACGDATPGPLEDDPGRAAPERRSETVSLSGCGAGDLGPYDVAVGGRLEVTTRGDVELEITGASSSCADGTCEVRGPARVSIDARARTTAPASVEVLWDATARGWIPCLSSEFPMGAAIIKTAYRRVGFGVETAAYDTDADRLTGVLAADGDWGEGDRVVEPPASDIFTLELPDGSRYRLTALHVTTKELEHWVWVTLWWSDHPDTDFGADRPASLTGPWAHYKMCVATTFDELDPDASGGATDPTLASALAAVHEAPDSASWCSNPYLEVGPGNAATNCVGCHQHAGAGLTSEEILDGSHPDEGRRLERLNFPTDYVFGAEDLTALFDYL